jgi:hypothetical protein
MRRVYGKALVRHPGDSLNHVCSQLKDTPPRLGVVTAAPRLGPWGTIRTGTAPDRGCAQPPFTQGELAHRGDVVVVCRWSDGSRRPPGCGKSSGAVGLLPCTGERGARYPTETLSALAVSAWADVEHRPRPYPKPPAKLPMPGRRTQLLVRRERPMGGAQPIRSKPRCISLRQTSVASASPRQRRRPNARLHRPSQNGPRRTTPPFTYA